MRDTQGPSICLHDPGFGVDATIEADLATMYQVWLGRRDLTAAIRAGDIDVQGPSAIVRRLPKAMLLSPIAYASAD
jgi:ubiquinone biosynthesis protein UbiJ